MDTLATLFGGILTALRAGLARHAGGQGARADRLMHLHRHLGRVVVRFERLFARFQAGTLPSQTGAKPRPSRAGQAPTGGPAAERIRLPSGRLWLVPLAQPPAAVAASHLRHWMAHPDVEKFLAAAPQAGRILRPLCRMLGIEASPDVPASLNLPPPPRFRPSPPPPPPCRGVIDPPEVVPLYRSWARDRSGRAWYQ